MAAPLPIARARGALSLGALLASGMFAAVGCVSVDDRDTVEAGASGEGQGGSSAKGGTGGTSAKGGTDAKGGSSNAGSGGSGKGGSGGTTSDVKCGDEVNPSSARLRACVYSMSCHPLQLSYTLSDCVTYGYVSNCESAAKSCADAEACTGFRREPDSLCRTGEVGWRCDGDVAVRCGASIVYSVDCARIADSCDPFESTQDETRWPCKLKSPASCDKDDPTKQTCSGSEYYSCIDGKAYGMDCAVYNYSCLEAAPGQGACSDRPVVCEDDIGVVSCSGDAIQVCDSTHHFGIYDCAPAGATCALEGTSEGYCLSPGCTGETVCDEKCLDDGSAQICVGSAAYNVDCTAYGFLGCVEYANHPTTGKNYVLCQPAPATAAAR